jgi:hypothetical protein
VAQIPELFGKAIVDPNVTADQWENIVGNSKADAIQVVQDSFPRSEWPPGRHPEVLID